MSISEYVEKYGIKNVINDYGEICTSYESSIAFTNGWVATIVTNENPDGTNIKAKYSVAPCDYNGYFNWDILNAHGAIDGCIYCNTEQEVIDACDIIRNFVNTN